MPVFSRGVSRRLCCDICGPFVADQRPPAAQERSGLSLSTPPSAWALYRMISGRFPRKAFPARYFLEWLVNRVMILSLISAFKAKLVIHKRMHVLSSCRVLRLSQAFGTAQTFQTHAPLVCQAQGKCFVVSCGAVVEFGYGEAVAPFSITKMVPGRPRHVLTPP